MALQEHLMKYEYDGPGMQKEIDEMLVNEEEAKKLNK